MAGSVAAPYQPALTPWRTSWRLSLTMLVSASAMGTSVSLIWALRPWLVWVDLALGVVCLVLVYFRRRAPLAVAIVTALATVVSLSASGPAVLAAVSLATRRRYWEIGTVGVVSVAVAMVNAWLVPEVSDGTPWALGLGVFVLVMALQLGWGMYLGSRRELLWTLRQRAERAEAEQALRAGQARATERARIAREMHDVLAHRISQISMHAGALAFRGDLNTEAQRSGAAEIQVQANQALDDLRGVLGVLRDGETGELLDRPQPTYADIPQLVSEAVAGGMRVELTTRIAPDDVPDGLGRTLYRIVQEGITNARKHAPGATLHITIWGDPTTGVDVTLTNPLGFGRSGTPGAGLGLVGLAERAELRGGRIEHDVSDDGFTLHGWLPWAA